MAVKFKAVGAVGAVASGNLTLTPPTTATDDIMVVPLTSHDNVALTFPGGWTIAQEGNNTAAMRATVAWKRCVGAEGAFTVTHAAGDCLIGRVYVYSGCVKTGSPIDASSFSANASSSTCTATTITPTGPDRLIVFTMHDSDDGLSSLEKLNGVNMTERGDNTTTLGLDAAVSLSDLQVFDIPPTGSATGTLSLGPDVNVGILLALIPQFGVTQPGGPGTAMYAYWDQFSANSTEFMPIQDLVATFPANAVNKALSPYDGVQLDVDLQLGDDGDGSQITTLAFDKGYLGFSTGKGLRDRISSAFGVQLSRLHLGHSTMAGSGQEGCALALGVAPVFDAVEILCYASQIIAAGGPFQLVAQAGELIDSTFENRGTGATDSFNIGAANLVVRRCAFIVATTTGPAITQWAPADSEGITVIGDPDSFIESSASTIIYTNSMQFLGTPATADIKVTVAPFDYGLTRPGWSGNGPQFSWAVEPLNGIETCREAWGYGIYCIDGNRLPISGVRATLVDETTGRTVFSTLTSAGLVTYVQANPFSLQPPPANCMYVRDHYCEVDLVPKTRDHNFTLTVNHPDDAEYQSQYLTRIRKFVGQRFDLLDIVQLAESPSSPPGWQECMVDAVA